jgi:hypothetical protein
MPDLAPEGQQAPVVPDSSSTIPAGMVEAPAVPGRPIEASTPQALGGAPAAEAPSPIAETAPAIESTPAVSTDPAPSVVATEPTVDSSVSQVTTSEPVPQVDPRALTEAQKAVQAPVEKPKGKSLKQRLMFWKHEEPAASEQKPPTAIPTPV